MGHHFFVSLFKLRYISGRHDFGGAEQRLIVYCELLEHSTHRAAALAVARKIFEIYGTGKRRKART